MNETKDVGQIELMRLVKAILKRWWLLVVPALVFALVALIYTKAYVTPMYKATSVMYIDASTSSTINLGELETAQQLVNSYEYLIKNIRQTLVEVSEKLEKNYDVSYSPEQLKGMISVKGGGSNTGFLEISVLCADKNDAARIANTIIEVVPARAAAVPMNSTISPASWANPNDIKSPATPNTSRNVLLGFVLGLILGVAVIVLLELLDDRVKSDDWVKQTFGEEIPLLAVIPAAGRMDRYDHYSKYYSAQMYSVTQDENS